MTKWLVCNEINQSRWFDVLIQGGTPIRETGDGPNFAHLPGGRREIRKYWTISHLGDGRWLALSGGGRSSRNAEGDGRKTKKVSGRWETVVFTYKNHFERRCDVPFHSFHQPEMLKGKCNTSIFPYIRRRGIPCSAKTAPPIFPSPHSARKSTPPLKSTIW